MGKTYVAILAGGRGERLWPKSRVVCPKQNLRIIGKRSIVEDAVRRAKRIASGNVFIVTNKESIGNAPRDVRRMGKRRLIVEPFGRNTAPAIGLAALLAHREDRDAVLVAMPSDHIVLDNKRFYRSIGIAVKEARDRRAIITMGIKPDSPRSSYGYIGVVDKVYKIPADSSYKVLRFVEKPTVGKAKAMLKSNRFLWNSGIFVFKTSVLLDALRIHVPRLYRGLNSLPDIREKRIFDKRLNTLYKNIEGDSLDYALMERYSNTRVVPSDFGWSDVGSFDSLYAILPKDKRGNAVLGSCATIDTENCLIYSTEKTMTGAIGLNNLAIVISEDAVLVCDRRRTEDVKLLVKRLKGNIEHQKFL
ncbi:MAG: mannose-1-phosphate guanylyltransferase [Candidatus Omnitrophica bacterium]|nr:mannose-1-phosphate guanylyltransferase [Candidatus Omnitrophota bacterium]